MELDNFNNIFLLGAGGIGVSALGRYFLLKGKNVAGYDRVSTDLTKKLKDEGLNIFYNDVPGEIPDLFRDTENTLIIYTPAIPKNNQLYNYFIKNRFTLKKRSEVLGFITSKYKTIAVAGTHGKTTVSTMIAHLLKQSGIACTAFLGGISKNYNSNFLYSENPEFVVVEADEYDRSFLRLFPFISIITSIDPDHLDIYGSVEQLNLTFSSFARNTKHDGLLIYKNGVDKKIDIAGEMVQKSYSLNDNENNYFAENIIGDKEYLSFDLVYPDGKIKGINPGIPGIINIENAVAAAAVALNAGISEDELKRGLKSFEGIKRRFDIQINREDFVYIDDYAHHPEELKAIINSVRKIFPGKKITGVFQPHLYSRTRDFADEFARSLELLDRLILLDIYPARELPIPGVTSELIFEKVNMADKTLCGNNELINKLSGRKLEVLLTFGAGNIDKYVEQIKEMFK